MRTTRRVSDPARLIHARGPTAHTPLLLPRLRYQLGLEGLHTDLPQITCDLEFKARRLQLRPPLEDLRTEFYREIKKFIAIPPSFKVRATDGPPV